VCSNLGCDYRTDQDGLRELQEKVRKAVSTYRPVVMLGQKGEPGSEDPSYQEVELRFDQIGWLNERRIIYACDEHQAWHIDPCFWEGFIPDGKAEDDKMIFEVLKAFAETEVADPTVGE